VVGSSLASRDRRGRKGSKPKLEFSVLALINYMKLSIISSL
jgi:hypothetical protein